MELYSCELGSNYSVSSIDNIKLSELQTLNLSHNDLSIHVDNKRAVNCLVAILSEEFGLISEAMETLYLVNVGIKYVTQQMTLIKSLSRMPGLYEIDVSENKGLKLDAFLNACRTNCTNLQTFQFTDNKVDKNLFNPVKMTDENGLEMVKRLDLDGSLAHEENIHFLVCSTAFCNVSYLNLSNCAITP